MNDLWLFLGCILFLFVLWVYSGGPNNPISFAGPYITPVTAPGVTQIGYWGTANDTLNVGNVASGGTYTTGQVIASAQSPYAGQVLISWSDPQSSNETSEYIHIHSNISADVDITGWQLVGAERSVHVFIPEGSRGTSSTKRDIVLSPDMTDAFIVTGSRASDDVKLNYANAWRAFLGDDDDIWQNDSDTITLLDQNGKVVDQYRY